MKVVSMVIVIFVITLVIGPWIVDSMEEEGLEAPMAQLDVGHVIKSDMSLQQKLDLASLFTSFFVSRPSFSVFFFIFWTKWRNFTGWFYFRLFSILFLNLAQIAV